MKKLTLNRRAAKQKGFTLIELLLVIGFIAAALVLAFITYPKVRATQNANVESQHITTIAASIKNLYSTAQSYSSISAQALVNAKALPDDMPQNGANVNNVWGGTVTIAPAVGPQGGANLGYTVTYNSVPAAECSKIASGVAVNFWNVTVGGTVVYNTGTGAQVAIDPATIAGLCNNTSNTIVFSGN